ncbi:S8 family serine peptidase [Mesorhizobium sp. B1-1-7]|uniref:S8 family serine peptidase n=1 Tax=Mesorhizobium sp. B1-1-7 TaxID=2589977 RepID=UPI0015E38263|nr:S8 family serine peptidase [Mesorhizobium sp. B1-1-7]
MLSDFDVSLLGKSNVVGQTANHPSESGRRVVIFEAPPEDVAAAARSFGSDVLIEPLIPHKLLVDRVGGVQDPHADNRLAAAQSIVVVVSGSGAVIQGAELTLVLRFGDAERRLAAVTDITGRGSFSFEPFWSAAALIVAPVEGFWPMVVTNPTGVQFKIDCPSLPTATSYVGWWHRLIGLTEYGPQAGNGIVIGVVDSGIGAHPYLGHVTDAGQFMNGQYFSAGVDVQSHGTHVCGIITARPKVSTEFGGISPGAHVVSVRVVPDEGDVNQGDIASAIDFLVETHGVDIINLSLGATEASTIVHDAVLNAIDHGVLCVCAAGNDGRAVNWPAAFSEVVAVSAAGKRDWAPVGSLAAAAESDINGNGENSDLFVPQFSSRGVEIDSIAGGVGIISTALNRDPSMAGYCAKDGSSMASPAVAAALAVLLSRSVRLGSLGRNSERAAYARELLSAAFVSIGVASTLGGMGVPRVS